MELFKYYGIDWLAMVMSFLALYSLGKKEKVGFLYGLVANCAWMAFGIMAGSVANPVANIIFLFLNVKGFSNWRNNEQKKGEEDSSEQV